MTDHQFAHDIAGEAAEALVDLQRRSVPGWDLEDAGDRLGHELLTTAIKKARASDGLLSEEGTDDRSRVDKARAWIVDPLDGSSGFGSGNPEWAVHVALAIDGDPTVGAVAVPGLGLIGSTLEPPVTPERNTDQPPIVVTGRSRSWTDGQLVAGGLGGELISCSSAGVKAMLVATGEADIYVHDAPLYEWDVCAPAAVAAAAGLHVSDTSGQALRFNQSRPVVPSVLICRPELADDVFALLGKPWF